MGLASLGRKEKCMRKDQIVVGKSYVNEHASIIREVVEEVDRRHVRANTFDLVTGKLVPTRHKTWRRSQLAVWADREADPVEAARVHPYETGGQPRRPASARVRRHTGGSGKGHTGCRPGLLAFAGEK